MLFKITNGAVSLGGESVLENIDFEIRDGEKIAVVGRNGAGKSTLLKCITGEITLEEGTGEEKFTVSRVEEPVIGYLEQITFADENVTLLDELLTCFSALLDMQAHIDLLHAQIEAGSDEKKIQEYSTLSERFELLGGYTYKKEYSVMVKKFGFCEDDLSKKIKDFSGGQRTKIAFMKLLLSHPDILLLDEPTNHLDIETVRWLEGYIKSYKSAVVLVSHDRMFIEKTADIIYEIEYGETHRYKGGYSDFEKQKKLNYEKQLKDFEYQKKEKERLLKLVERFRYKASKAAFAQAKLKQIEKVKTIENPEEADTKSFHTSFQPLEESVKRVLSVNSLEVGYETAFAKINFELLRGEKLGIIGENGCGKSTFLKTLVKEIKPLSGEFTFGEKTHIGYFDQKLAEKKSAKTIKDDFHDEFPGLTETEVRSALGAFLFSGDDVFKTVNELSGGERVRLALCKLFRRRPNVLILDEPTNHLDIIGRQTLEDMLYRYEGTIICVSHDRYFINKIADRLLVFSEGEAKFFPYGYEEYEEKNQDLSAPEVNASAPEVKEKSNSEIDRQAFKDRSKMQKRISKLEELMAECDSTKGKLKAELENPELTSDYVRLSEIQEKIEACEKKQEEYMQEWMELLEELE